MRRDQARTIEALYDAHFDEIFRYVVRRVGRIDEAEDLTAQTFYKALRSLRRWTDGHPRAWLYRIATNVVNDHFRRRRSADEAQQGLAAPSSEQAAAERQLAQHRLFLDLHGALGELPLEDQSLIALRFFEQLPFPEIARIVDRRQGTVVMRTHRALKKLKDRLQRRGIDHDEIRGLLDADAPAGAEPARLQARAAP